MAFHLSQSVSIVPVACFPEPCDKRSTWRKKQTVRKCPPPRFTFLFWDSALRYLFFTSRAKPLTFYCPALFPVARGTSLSMLDEQRTLKQCSASRWQEKKKPRVERTSLVSAGSSAKYSPALPSPPENRLLLAFYWPCGYIYLGNNYPSTPPTPPSSSPGKLSDYISQLGDRLISSESSRGDGKPAETGSERLLSIQREQTNLTNLHLGEQEREQCWGRRKRFALPGWCWGCWRRFWPSQTSFVSKSRARCVRGGRGVWLCVRDIKRTTPVTIYAGDRTVV